MAGFKEAWLRFHPEDTAVGHQISHNQNGNCTRFHVLPDSAAIAKNYTEIVEMLCRYDALARDILGDNQPCWMVVPEWQDPTGHPEHIEVASDIPLSNFEGDTHAGLGKHHQIWRRRILRICKTCGLTFDWSFYDPSDEVIYDIRAGLVTWEVGRFKRLLLNIYKERVGGIFWMNPESGAIFAPYHAGIDIRVPTAEQLHALRRKFKDWLPTNGHGFLYVSKPE